MIRKAIFGGADRSDPIIEQAEVWVRVTDLIRQAGISDQTFYR